MKKIFQFFEKIHEYHIDEYAASCAYYTILAFIPLMMLILTLTKYIGIEKQALFLVFNELIPSNVLNDAIMEIIKEVYSKSVGTITISAIFTLWSAEKGFFAICKGLNEIHHVAKQPKMMKYRIRALIFTIIFIISIVFTLLLLVFGNSIHIILQERFHIFSQYLHLILKNRILISSITLSVLFTIMYYFIPEHRNKFRYTVPGAIIATLGCNFVSVFYSIYIRLFTGFSLMYGSLTTIVLAMMWLYACIYSILLGAMIHQEMIHNQQNQ